MKVLVISHMYPSAFNEVSGIFVHQQVRELIKQGCEVKVVSPVPWSPFPIKHFNAKWQAYAELPPLEKWDGVEVYHPRYIVFPRSYLFEYSGYFLYQGLKRVVGNVATLFDFDLIHAHVALPAGFAAMLLKQGCKKPLVVTIHGMDLLRTVHRNIHCKKALSKVFAQADRIVTVSTKLKNIAESELGYSEKITVINNGTASDRLVFRETGLDELATKCLGHNKTILSVSSLIAQKGVGYNLRAMAQLVEKHPNLKYVIVGDGPELNNLQALVSDLKLNRHVEFLGRLSHELAMNQMAKADVFSMPSWNEGFGVVYIEAMAFGKPVIACQGEGIEDVVKDGNTGLLVRPKDVDSLASALDFLLSKPEEAHAIGERGKMLVLGNYTWEINVAKTIKVYEEVLNHWVNRSLS